MSITTPHAAYTNALYTWQTLRDAYTGSGAVKGQPGMYSATRGVQVTGTRYLPRPNGMKLTEQYAAYRDRAIWLGATERAVHGITEAIVRKELQHTAPAAIEPHLEDITLTGVPLASFAEQVVRETLLMGRCGVLVDFPAPVSTAPETPQTPMAGARPYWCLRRAEDIMNWRTTQYQGDTTLTLVVLKEVVSEPQGVWPSPDFFVVKDRLQYRVLRLNEAGQYEVSLWMETGRSLGQTPVLVMRDVWVPLASGQPLPFIPFMFFNPFSLEPMIEKSLLEALVEINYQHYRHSADYEHGLHLTALPTPYICASNLELSTELLIGSATAWIIPDSTAKVGMLEFQGQGLQSHERAMDTDIKNMAALGARLLEGMPLVAETATGVLARSQGAESPAKSLAKTVSLGLTQALQIHAWWAGAATVPDDDAIYIRLNTDLVSNRMEPAMLKVLMEALLNGTMSKQAFHWNLARGDLLPPGVSFEEEQALIEAQQMALPLAGPSMNGVPQGGVNGQRTAA